MELDVFWRTDMALNAGNSACTTGASKALYDLMKTGVTGFQDTAAGKELCFVLASWMVAEITSNAKAVVDVTSAGLQTSAAPGAPTGPPVLKQLLGIE
jgi:hypothetical protein